MEWRIIVPVLCLIGILHVPGNAAQTNSTGNNSVYNFNLHFSINGTFKANYLNNSDTETIQLKNNITTDVESVFRNAFQSSFIHFEITQLSNGSIAIVTDGVLHFNSNGSALNVSSLTAAMLNGNFVTAIIKSSINISVFQSPVAPTTTIPSVSTPAKIANISLVFRILQIFKDVYASPNAKDAMLNAIQSGNFSFTVNNTTISAVAINGTSNGTNTTATTQATATASSTIVNYTIIFKLIQVFNSNLQNMSSSAAINLANQITGQLDPFYKKFAGFLQSVIYQFKSGSVIVLGALQFNGTTPNSTDLAKQLAAAVRNGTISLQIDPASIVITDSSGNAGNSSPVLASMLTALWMTLASLLFSAMMH